MIARRALNSRDKAVNRDRSQSLQGLAFSCLMWRLNSLIVVNFKFALNCNECELSITGAVFNNNNNYYLYKIKGGLDVQVTPKHRNNLCYEYGIMIFEEDDMIKFHVYHNGHGPFC